MDKRNEEILKLYYQQQQKRKHILIGLAFVLFILMIVVGIGYVNRNTVIYYYNQYTETIPLKLTEDKVTIKLSEKKDFDVKDYLKSYDKKHNSITYPKNVIKDVKKGGTYILIYSSSNDIKSTDKELKVIVKDDVAPKLELTTDSITIQKGDKIDYKKYIKSFSDETTKLKKSDVKYTTLGEYEVGETTIVYTVSDDANNITSKELKVIVNGDVTVQAENKSEGKTADEIAKEQEEKAKAEAEAQRLAEEQKKQQETQAQQNQNNQSSGSTTTVKKGSPTNKTFYFKDYNDSAVQTLTAAKSYAQGQLNSTTAKGYKWTPVRENGTGDYIAYAITFN